MYDCIFVQLLNKEYNSSPASIVFAIPSRYKNVTRQIDLFNRLSHKGFNDADKDRISKLLCDSTELGFVCDVAADIQIEKSE